MGMAVSGRIRVGGFVTTNIVLPKPPRIELYILGGGGGGGGASGIAGTGIGSNLSQWPGAGGGAGGLLVNLSYAITPGTTYTFTIGAGGTKGAGKTGSGQVGTNGTKGGDTTWTVGGTTLRAFGGGAGVNDNSSAANGGCGGGASGYSGATRGTAVSGQGFLGLKGSAGGVGGPGGGIGSNAFAVGDGGTGKWIPDGRKGFLFLGPGGNGGKWTVGSGFLPVAATRFGEGGQGGPWRANYANDGMNGFQGLIIICYQAVYAPAVAVTGASSSSGVIAGTQYYYLTSSGTIRW